MKYETDKPCTRLALNIALIAEDAMGRHELGSV